jgi:hypothetical protein
MNDLKQIWKDGGNSADMLEKILQSRSFKKASEKSPLSILKRNLAIHLVYAVIITLAYAFIIYYFPYWQVQACMLLLIVFNFWAMHTSYNLYKGINLNVSEYNVLQDLKYHYHAFTQWQKLSLRVALFVYPFALAGGFMLGGTIGSGKGVEEFMSKGPVLIALVISIIVLVPLSYLLAKWMTRVAFGKYVDQLKERIDELENEN